MLEHDKDRFGKAFDLLTAGFFLDAPSRTKATYFDALNDLDISILEHAARSLAASWTRRQGCPLPGDWRAAANTYDANSSRNSHYDTHRTWSDEWTLRTDDKGRVFARKT